MFARTCLLFGVVCQNCEHDCKFRPCFISQVLSRIYPTWRLVECATSDFKFDAHPILDRHSIESTFCTPSNPPLSVTSVPACPNHKLNKLEAMGMCYFWSNDLSDLSLHILQSSICSAEAASRKKGQQLASASNNYWRHYRPCTLLISNCVWKEHGFPHACTNGGIECVLLLELPFST